MDSIYKINNKVEFGLRVFGHQHAAQENNCYDTKREVMFSKDNRTQMQLRLADIHPAGVTPIAYSLQEAAENDLLEENKYAYSIVLITDGGESCGGDICEVVKKLLDKKIYFKPYIVSMVDYAPLKTDYACLGNYLQATDEVSIAQSVDSIVTAFRPALVLTTAQYKQYLETKVMPPEALQIHNTTEVKVETHEPEPVQTINVPEVKTEEPTNTLETKNAGEIKTQTQAPDVHVVNVPPVIKKEEVNKIRSVSATTFIFPVVFTTRAVNKVKLPPIVVAPKTIETFLQPNKGATQKTDVTPKDAPFSIKTEDSKETTVQIYFTDGRGKFYSTTPQIALTDPGTGKEVKKFFRMIDAANNPDPIQLPAGKYDLAVVNGKTKAHNIVITPGKNNKIFLEVHNGSLRFYYIGNKDRPVSEFKALVTRREIGGKEINQKCTEVLEYESGTYHIQINTLPATDLYTDLEFDKELQVGIDEPGWIQFTNTNKIGKVSLYTILGDRYLMFYSMDVNGFPESQKLRLKPGLYKVHYLKYSGSNIVMEEKVEDFKVKSNETTQMELTQIELHK